MAKPYINPAIKAIPKLGPIHEYFNFIIKPLATMLKSRYSSEELKMDILNVLHGGIALDSMPDYFMILNDALLDMITLSFHKRPESNQVVEKALNVLDSMKWAMLRANMWTREYDVSIEGQGCAFCDF